MLLPEIGGRIKPMRDDMMVTVRAIPVLEYDLDGVVIIPKHIEKEVIEKAYEKATGEKTVGNAIRAGMSAKETFAKYSIM